MPGLRVPFLDLSRQYAELRDELVSSATRVLDSGRYILGPENEAFSAEFARMHGAPFCAGVASGTDALKLSLEAAGVGPGDEVALPALTFVATATVVSALGARPRFVDVEPDSLTMSPEDLERRITPRVKAVIPVHLYGLPARLDAILRIARSKGLAVVEDCAQSHGAVFAGKPVGSHGDFGAFSFYPTKNIGACGDAGAITAVDEARFAAVMLLRDCGRRPGARYDHIVASNHSRLDELQAALLRVKLPHLEEWTRQRRSAAARYTRGLQGLPVSLPPADPENGRHVYHQYVLQTPERDALAKSLEKRGVGSGIYYPMPLHRLEAYRNLGYTEGDFPEAERAAKEVLSLPMFSELRDDEIEAVIESVRAHFS
ncbi:MAG: erythromycin biosynthesis sensory transduction protein eryC1 [Elusimicrobia bacterium CG_4_9_14_3_um_filter_62_55]|nr:MAG: erythromycin biosynthesis sensory transduction protein eryC1 [Elusimicrobia bacterium CG22_combo_CG10-13_8_21_14_all_63_91]PJA17529.1 MAG: erythromycin biosynthesis sensory transduction protein eryC1 [Elusimicrobia bacterium CG_4_10_14_0_2_um_filter_63_34]PJB24044.1 MAG: erythromycin biosynthesis sensory transduction protein eryC1 [Elusimicrobia bacterium CG_4_9_14_3_um_filter_62_55]